MQEKIKVLLIDDSKFIRTLFTGLLSQTQDIEVVDTALDSVEAREKIKLYNPNIIILDVETSEMDGVNFIEKIMRLKPTPVIMLSKSTVKGADTTLRALELGAIDYLTKPEDFNAYSDLDTLKNELVEKIRNAVNARVITSNLGSKEARKVLQFTPSANSPSKIIAIAASTGGVEALKGVLSKMPFTCPPIVVTQNMPEKFIEALAKRLNAVTQVEVLEARDGQKLQRGKVYIAPGGTNLTVVKTEAGGMLHIVKSDQPSANMMFKSVAAAYGKEAIGVVLTGMGSDGAEGLKIMSAEGATNIAQNKDTCVVYDMPRAAKELGAITHEYPIESIAEELLKRCL